VEVVVCWADVELDEVLGLIGDEVELVFVLEPLDRVDDEVDIGVLEDEVELVFVLEPLDRVDEEDVGLLEEGEVKLLDRIGVEVDVRLLVVL